VVRIEIGRVEIRSDPPAAARPQRPASRRQQAPDLADYLKKRADGRS
jgi:hypothetical protein